MHWFVQDIDTLDRVVMHIYSGGKINNYVGFNAKPSLCESSLQSRCSSHLMASIAGVCESSGYPTTRKRPRCWLIHIFINIYIYTSFHPSFLVYYVFQTVTPLNEECGLLEWVSNTTGFRSILMGFYRERGIYTGGRELKAMALPANASAQYVD